MRNTICRTAAVCCCLLFLFCVPAAADTGAVAGDLDGNGRVTLRDALVVLKAAAKMETLEADRQAAADVNGDGSADAKDALLLFKKATGNLYFLPGEKIEASGQIYIAGDSIASPHDPDPTYQRQLVGWGVVLGDLFDASVNVHNEARSGTSAKSYLGTTNYPAFINQLAPGDYFLISFGHNDEKVSDPGRYTDPKGESDTPESYKWYLKKYYIEPAVRAGAYPVLLSSVVRCTFDAKGILTAQSHAAYAAAMAELAEECRAEGLQVGYIDLQKLTGDYYRTVGQTEAESLHAFDAKELDTTHYCEKGARLAAQIITEEMQRQEYDICKFLKPAD